MTTHPVRTRRWTRKPYDRLVELGGWRDAELRPFRAGATIAPLRPAAAIAVADLLP